VADVPSGPSWTAPPLPTIRIENKLKIFGVFTDVEIHLVIWVMGLEL
jgi:hypothetical protein